METSNNEKTLHVAVVNPTRRQLLLERRRLFIASPTEVTKEDSLHLPSRPLPDNTSPERCANQLIQSRLNIATAAFAGLRPIGDDYGYAVRPASLVEIKEAAPGFELHTAESIEENKELLPDHTFNFALQALAHTQKRRY